MAMHKKRKGMGRGTRSSRRHSSRRRSSIESGGRTSGMEQGERS
jgi:hypothetical protein